MKRFIEGALKLDMHGYPDRVRSSRRMEREASRNAEVMWPTGRRLPGAGA